MKQAIFFTAFIAVTACSYAQGNPGIKDIHYNGTTTSVSTDAANPQAMQQLVSQIMKTTGLQPNFTLKEKKVRNIEASVSHQKRYILYNPEFITWINNATQSKWGCIALLAHEIGHHLNGHTIRRRGSNPQAELEADEFAGFVLFKLGASLEEAQKVMNYIARTDASSTHPARADRLLAIQNGWNKANTIPVNGSEQTAKNNLNSSVGTDQ